ncbi:MAG: ACP S-malonyltransferase [Gammaproteobacteria bacterium]|nr:MAG: ACP S-malonyltransferase [Gammaproteobacteria bacterium]
MMNYAYVFPGQGSQSVGMMTAWEDHQSRVVDIFTQASESLGYDLWAVVREGPEAQLNQTEITQPAMLCAGVACWHIAAAQKDMPPAMMMAGHSLGEYTALVCAGSLSLTDAVRLVAKRGHLMQSTVAAGAGSMAAIIGLSDEDVVKACAQVEAGVVEAVNFNAPGQVVIAGETAAVEAAMEQASGLGARRALQLPVSVPSHCSLMKDAARQLAEELETIDIKMPQVPVIHNQSATIAESADEIRERLQLQLHQPVKWVTSVEFMHRRGINALIECGPGKVLSGLTRRIEKSLQAFAIFDAASLESTQQSLGEE